MRFVFVLPFALLGCTALDQVGRAPQFSSLDQSFQHSAMYATPMPDDVVRGLQPDAHTAIVALTHDPKLDDMALLEALISDAFYVGALGS